MCHPKSFCVVVLFLSNILCAHCVINVNDQKFRELPPIFHIDNYEACKENKHLFCKLSIVLEPQPKENNTSEFWEVIEETIADKRFYNHNELFHAICVQSFCDDLNGLTTYDDFTFLEKLSKCYTSRYHNLGLTGKVISANCNKYDSTYTAAFVDYAVLVVIVSYFTLIVTATWRDYQIRYGLGKKRLISTRLEDVAVTSFSIITNWIKLKEQNEKSDFQQLKFIQGIRFYNMLLIIFCHTVSSYIGGYVANTSYFETVDTNIIRLGIRTLLVFLVQTFFLLSAFLLSFHLLQIIDREKHFKFRYIFLSFVNRYLRIISPVVVMIGFGSTIWAINVFYGPIKDLYSDFEYQMCRKNWWTTLLFINNHYNQQDMCYFITWYLAADTQLYVLSLVVLSLIWIFPHKIKLILVCFVSTGILVPAVISHIYNLDIIFRITPENSKNNKFRSFTFNAIYSSTYANMATYMVGICFGYFYLKWRSNGMFNRPILRYTWAIFFVGLPVTVVIISCYEYSRIFSTILCGVLKPLYATGLGIGILGMSQNLGGVARRICEWKPAIFLGNFTYSTYVIHYGIVFWRTAVAKQPLFVSDFILITSFVHDAVLSFLFGLFMHILVEMPALNLQHRFVPQVRRRK